MENNLLSGPYDGSIELSLLLSTDIVSGGHNPGNASWFHPNEDYLNGQSLQFVTIGQPFDSLFFLYQLRNDKPHGTDNSTTTYARKWVQDRPSASEDSHPEATVSPDSQSKTSSTPSSTSTTQTYRFSTTTAPGITLRDVRFALPLDACRYLHGGDKLRQTP